MSSAASAARRGTVYDQAAYWLTVVAVYFLVGVLFFYSGKGKLFDQDGKAPAPLREQFEGTFPGIDTYFASTAIIFLLVLRLPPNGPPDWLSARRRAAQ